MLSFVAILATSSPIICSDFRILTQVVCGLHGVQLLQNCSINIVFYVVFSVPFSHRPSMGFVWSRQMQMELISRKEFDSR